MKLTWNRQTSHKLNSILEFNLAMANILLNVHSNCKGFTLNKDSINCVTDDNSIELIIKLDRFVNSIKFVHNELLIEINSNSVQFESGDDNPKLIGLKAHSVLFHRNFISSYLNNPPTKIEWIEILKQH